MKSNSFWSLLINPFTKLGGWKAFIIGFTIMLVSTVVGYLAGTVPVGLFSIRPIPDVSIATVFMCQLAVLITLFAAMYITALIATKHVRFQDVLGITTLAQAPSLLLFAASPAIKPLGDAAIAFVKGDNPNALNQLQATTSYLIILVVAILMLVVIVWYIMVLYNAFRTLTDLRGAKGIVVFILVVVLLCNALSMPLISLFTNGAVNPFTIY